MFKPLRKLPYCESVPAQLDPARSVVRASINDVPSLANWQPWDGVGWNPDLTQAATVLHGPPGDLSASFNPHLCQFIAVYNGIFPDDIWMRSAPRPKGPWSDPRMLLTALHHLGQRPRGEGVAGA